MALILESALWMESFEPRISISIFLAAVMRMVIVIRTFFLICWIISKISGEVEKSSTIFFRDSKAVDGRLLAVDRNDIGGDKGITGLTRGSI
jgi:hypothetical protein